MFLQDLTIDTFETPSETQILFNGVSLSLCNHTTT
jgi:hypothetical protein